MKTVGMEQDLWAAMYLSLLEYGTCLFRQGAPLKHVHLLLHTLVPPIAAAAGHPKALVALEADLKAAIASRERAVAAFTN